MKQKAAHQNILYGFYNQAHRRNGTLYAYRYARAVDGARTIAKAGMVGVVVRHTINFMGAHKLGVMKAALEGMAREFIVGTEVLEAYAPEGEGIRRVDLRGLANWDSKLKALQWKVSRRTA
jgi:hypothetical protein